MRLCYCLLIALTVPGWSSLAGQGGGPTPVLHYEEPIGFSRARDDSQLWIADSLDGVIHVYPFRPFRGDFVDEFHRTMFQSWIAVPYREDKRLGQPNFKPLTVRGAQAAVAATFTNFNGGAPREHLRVAILASDCVALIDSSANSPPAFDRNQPSFSRLLNSLRVVEGNHSASPAPRQRRPGGRSVDRSWIEIGASMH